MSIFTLLAWAGLVPACAMAQPVISPADFGAAGDGATDDTAALQRTIDASPDAATIDFGGSALRYRISRTLVLLPNRTYCGQATIRLAEGAPPGEPLLLSQYGQSDNIRITGLTLDAAGIGGGLQLTVKGAAALPGRGVEIDGVTFLNARSPAEPWESAIYASVGLVTAKITGNHFVNCGGGIYLTSPGSIEISGNEFETITHGNAVTLIFEQRPFRYANGIVVARNHGRRLKRMGIELFRVSGIGPAAPRIEGNIFEDWAPDAGHESFGISVVAGDGAQVVGNRLLGGVGPLGIELGSTAATVQDNEVTGWDIGIVLQHNVNGSVIGRNQLRDQRESGISFSNAPGDKANVRVESNTIVNPRSFGIFSLTESWRGTKISGNTISRTAGKWPGDTNATFYGIVPFPAPGIEISGNRILQDSAGLLPGFQFVPIRSVTGIVEHANQVSVQSGRPPRRLGARRSRSWRDRDPLASAATQPGRQ